MLFLTHCVILYVYNMSFWNMHQFPGEFHTLNFLTMRNNFSYPHFWQLSPLRLSILKFITRIYAPGNHLNCIFRFAPLFPDFINSWLVKRILCDLKTAPWTTVWYQRLVLRICYVNSVSWSDPSVSTRSGGRTSTSSWFIVTGRWFDLTLTCIIYCFISCHYI